MTTKRSTATTNSVKVEYGYQKTIREFTGTNSLRDAKAFIRRIEAESGSKKEARIVL